MGSLRLKLFLKLRLTALVQVSSYVLESQHQLAVHDVETR